MQSTAPGAEYVPAGHNKHVAEEEARVALEYRPAAQGVAAV